MKSHIAPEPRLPARILVVDHDADSLEAATQSLRLRGHQVEPSDDMGLVSLAARRGFDLLVLSPETRLRRGPDPWQQLRELRATGGSLPVLVLLQASHAADRAVALELGADAVLDKPFHPGELRARVQALLRRSRPSTPTSATALRVGDWQLDPDTRTLQAPTGLQVHLSEAECALLRAFLEHPRSTLNRQQLMDLARGQGVQQLDRSIDLLVSRLRHKLDDDPRAPRLIHTVRGVGYLFQALAGDDHHTGHPTT
ncbi:response regulator transcription factor [Ideonella sp. B7]|uniref:winged helix-turn-helix domain-containing protein n=1 Tax=Ideonella benzenivorans TaxID=2831643 RepID=UPI001CED815E|nr:response regulator transcription factor [Ideonella benzenivorans]MCA6218796.1 response regulator transcription factor [Ideonella benzenivorans]